MLTPWNPALWWQLRRLRLAVEADCDARVLRRRADVRAYGSVLLEVGRRASRGRLAAAAAFAEPVSTLERRIRIMTAPRVRRPLLRAAGLGALAAALAVAACEAPAPTQEPPVAAPQSTVAAIDARSAIRQYFPEVARGGMPAGDILLFVVSADGRVVRHQRVSGGEMEATRVARTGTERDQFRSVEMSERPAGELAPTAVQMVWYRMRGDGDDPSLSTYSRDVPPGTHRPGSMRLTNVRTPGAQAMVGIDEVSGGGAAPDVASLRSVLKRYAAPASWGGAGETDEAAAVIEYTVGADGRARDLQVRAKPDAVEPVARGVAAALRFPAAAANRHGEMMLHLGPERRPEPDPR